MEDNRLNRYRFLPADAPTLEEMKLYVDDNLNRISNALMLIEQTNIPFQSIDPYELSQGRLEDGMIIRAIGSNVMPNGWSPDGGAGTYIWWDDIGDGTGEGKWEKLGGNFFPRTWYLTGESKRRYI